MVISSSHLSSSKVSVAKKPALMIVTSTGPLGLTAFASFAGADDCEMSISVAQWLTDVSDSEGTLDDLDVPITFHPREAYVVARALPRPRVAPTISTVGMLEFVE